MKYISHDNFYLMCEPYPQDLAHGIEYFLTHPQEMPMLGQKAKCELEEKLYWDKIAHVMIDNYQRIINTGD